MRLVVFRRADPSTMVVGLALSWLIWNHEMSTVQRPVPKKHVAVIWGWHMAMAVNPYPVTSNPSMHRGPASHMAVIPNALTLMIRLSVFGWTSMVHHYLAIASASPYSPNGNHVSIQVQLGC